MSLLLDALKKAAQEKQNADSAEGNAVPAVELGLERDAELEFELECEQIKKIK